MVFDDNRNRKLNDLMSSMSNGYWGQFILANKVSVLKLLMIYFFAISWIIMVVAYGVSSVFFNMPLANPAVGDYQFHVQRAIDYTQHGINTKDYYAPFIHILIAMFGASKISDGIMIVIPFLIYFVLPLSFYKLAKIYHGSTSTAIVSALLYFFLYDSIFYVFNATYAQALNAIFVCATLYYGISLIRDEHGALFGTIYFAILGLFTHSMGGIVCMTILLIALFLSQRDKTLILMIILLLILALKFPFIFRQGIAVVGNLANTVSKVNIFHTIVRLAYILNPIILFYGMKGIRLANKDDLLLYSVAIISIVMIPFDTQFRSTLMLMMILAIPAGKKIHDIIKYEDERKGLTLIAICFVAWILTTLGHIGLLYMYFYTKSLNILP